MSKLLKYLQVSRAQTVVMPLLISGLAYVYSVDSDCVNFKSFIFTVMSSILFLLSVNTLSEYRDCIIGLDEQFAYSTKYRLVTGILPQKNVLIFSYVTFFCAILSGLVAVFHTTCMLFIPGVIGALIVLDYSEGIKLKYHALGEISVFVVYGVLLGWGYLLSLTGRTHFGQVLIFIPGGIFITCILLANNIRDYKYDLYKVKTLVTILGMKKSTILLYTLANIAFLAYFILIKCDVLNSNVYFLYFTYPILVWSFFKRKSQKNINFFGLLFVLTELIVILSFCIL